MLPHHAMARCLELAERGGRNVMPNPMVGCVIVRDDRVIGEGYHSQFGGPHAEVVALNSVADKTLLEKSTLYVSLEPCSHFGKTPPCVDALLTAKIPSVVVGCRDPFKEVSGRGIEKLIQHGVTVTEGVLGDECLLLNRRFVLAHRLGRPFIILKWAMTCDGFIARSDYSSKWISCVESRKLVHRWRSEEMSIMVGSNTARIDNPNLTVREVLGTNPLRVVLDRHRSLPSTHNVFNQEAPTIVYNEALTERKGNIEFVGIGAARDLGSVLKDLYSRGVISLFVEGGSTILNACIESGVWDEARVFVSKERFGTGLKAPELPGDVKSEETVGTDLLKKYQHPEFARRLGLAASAVRLG